MIVNALKQLIQQRKNNENTFYLRNFLKEKIQDYILNFVYNDQNYKKLIFTGGTCLRKVYGLPRLSEDLDFDFRKDFDITSFSQKIKDYFVKTMQYKALETKISGNNKTVFLKFPILKEIGLANSISDSQLLFVRCDFSEENIGIYNIEVNSISTSEFTLFTLSYDLSTLFANKISAFLEREFFKGKEQKIPFKGRDVFDLVWFLEKSKKSNWQIKPNWERVFKSLNSDNKSAIIKMLVEKVEKLDKKQVYDDLLPFIESLSSVKNFSDNFEAIIRLNIQQVV